MLRQRVLTALVLGTLLAWVLFFNDPWVWRLFLLVAGALAADEWAALGGSGRAARLAYAALVVAAGALLLDRPVAAGLDHWLLVAALPFWCALVPLQLWRGWRLPPGPLFLLAGLLVVLPTLCALSRLRDGGALLLVASMAVIWVSDIAAYFAGRAFGRHRLAPSISPGKTWEGVGGALAGVLAYGLLVGWLASPGSALAQARQLAGPAWWLLLLALAALGIEGDLFESWIKRCAGVKDSGWILPGHGGVLDRIDALTAALPLAALLSLRVLPGGGTT